MEKYLVINAGSSSLKFSLYELIDNEEKEIVNGYVEKIGKDDSFYSLKNESGRIEKHKLIQNHTEAVDIMIKELLDNNFINNINDINGIGHRVLHAGEYYKDSVLIDEDSLKVIESLTKLGPLHMPGQISGIKSMKYALPDVPQVAVFDTTFHQTIEQKRYLYAIPYELYEKYKIRRYGFHGTSYRYITETMKEKLGKEDVNLIICHLGSGGSICSVKNSKSLNTTMGFTPNDGIIMCTRSGADFGASNIKYLSEESNMSLKEIDNMLNKESGLKGLVGVTDFRDLDKLVDEGNKKAIEAWEKVKLSICNFLSFYIDELQNELDNENIDAIVFTAGIGENNPRFRKGIIDFYKHRGIKINEIENNKVAKFLEKTSGIISEKTSTIPVHVLPTNEELMILKDTKRIVKEYKNNIKIYKLEK